MMTVAKKVSGGTCVMKNPPQKKNVTELTSNQI